MDDNALVRRARDGDMRAFKQLIEQNQRRIFSLALGYLQNREDARDVTQEVFLRAHRTLPHFQGGQYFHAWLCRIATNLCVDLLRKRGRGGGHAEEFDEALPMGAGDGSGLLGERLGTSPQAAVLKSELSRKVMEAVGQLPEKLRGALLLKEIHGLDYKEIAKTLDIPEGTVMSRVFRARLHLQGVLRKYVEDDDSSPRRAAGE